MKTWNNLICSTLLILFCLQANANKYSTNDLEDHLITIDDCSEELSTIEYDDSPYNQSSVWKIRQNDKDRIIVIGTASQLANKVAKNQDVKFRKASDNETTANVTALVKNADAIMIDVKGIPANSFSQNIYLQQAMKHHVPVIAENISQEELGKVTGFGVDAKAVLFNSKVEGNGVNIKFLSTVGETRLEEGAEQSFTPKYTATKIDSNKVKALAKKYNMPINRSKKMKQVSANAPKKQRLGFQQSEIGISEQFQLIKEELKIKKRIKKEQLNNIRGGNFDSGRSRGAGGPMFSDFETVISKKESTTSMEAPSSWTITASFGTKTWNSGPYGQTHRIYINYDITMAATSQFKYVIIKPIGTGFHPGSLLNDKWGVKGFYQEKLSVEYGFRDNNTDFELLHTAPPNANNSSSLAVSTGWSVGASKDGPSLSYSENSVLTRTLKDFEVINKSVFPRASWEYKLSSTTGGEYKDWEDLGNAYGGRGWFEPGLHDLPTLAKENLMPSSEAVFRLENSAARGRKYLYFKNQQNTRYVWRDSFVPSFLWSPAVPTYKQLNYWHWFSLNWWINLDYVSV